MLAAVKMAEVSFYSTLARAARDKDTCDVTYFVKGCAMPIDGVVKIVRPGHGHEIVCRAVIGRCATDPEIGTRCAD